MSLRSKLLVIVCITVTAHSLPTAKLGTTTFRVPSLLRYEGIYKPHVEHFLESLGGIKDSMEAFKPDFYSNFLDGAKVLELISTALDELVISRFSFQIRSRFVSVRKYEAFTEKALWEEILIENKLLNEDSFAEFKTEKNVQQDPIAAENLEEAFPVVALRLKAEFEAIVKDKLLWLKNTLAILKKDFAAVKALYLSPKSENEFVLDNVTAGNADKHKQGLCVSFLEFTDLAKQSPNVKVVFKPSSVLVDFAITANTHKFCTIDSEPFASLCHGHFTSLVERINAGLQLAEEERLPTITILPIESDSEETANRIKAARGYLEYIPSDFSACHLSKLELYDLLYGQKTAYLKQKKLSDVIEVFQAYFLQVVNKNPLAKAGAQRLFWKKRAMMLGLLYLVRSSDIHRENMITKGTDSFAIDLENSVGMKAQNAGSVLNFEVFKCSKGEYLFQKDDVLKFESELQANELVNALYVHETKLHSVDLNEEVFNEGLLSLAEFFLKSPKTFVDWAKEKLTGRLVVREVPLGTPVFYGLVATVSHDEAKFLEFYTNLKKKTVVISEGVEIHLSVLFTKEVRSMLAQKIIPSFYMSVNEQMLYTSSGSKLDGSDLISEDVEKKEVYSSKKPLEVLLEFWEDLAKKDKASIKSLMLPESII